MHPGPPIDADARRVQQLKIAAVVVGGLIVVTVIALALSGNGKHSPTSLKAGATTTTSEGGSTTTSTPGASTTTIQPAQTTTPPTTAAAPVAASTTVVASGGGCSPAGDLHPILFVRHGVNGPPWHIWRYDPATCASAQLTHDNGNPGVLNWGESWSPTRDRIAFVRKDAGLMVMNADGTHERLLFAEQNNNQSSGAWTAWSPDGKRIAFSGRTDGLWLVDVSTGKATNVVNDGGCRSATWSPDGARVAFDLNGRVITIKADGTGRKDIAAGNEPDWGPDNRIVFNPLPGSGLAVMNADGTGIKKLVDDSTAGEPEWSPDGRQIVYASNAAGITIINADGSGRRVVVSDGQHNNQPAW